MCSEYVQIGVRVAEKNLELKVSYCMAVIL